MYYMKFDNFHQVGWRDSLHSRPFWGQPSVFASSVFEKKNIE